MFTESGNQKPQVTVEIGKRADGRAGIAEVIALGKGDYGSQAGDLLHLGPPQLVQELTGIGRQSLQVAALALTGEDIKGQ